MYQKLTAAKENNKNPKSAEISQLRLNFFTLDKIFHLKMEILNLMKFHEKMKNPEEIELRVLIKFLDLKEI